jgi:putative tRNA adenosine deaminase-associated protein
MKPAVNENDIGVVALHEDGHWSVSTLTHTRELGAIIDQIKAQPTNGGAIALISIDEDFFVIIRSLGSQLQMMISDVTYALDSDFASDIIDALDLPFPEEDDPAQPGGDIDLLSDLGISARELETIADDLELFPDEQIEALAARLGFVERYLELTGE